MNFQMIRSSAIHGSKMFIMLVPIVLLVNTVMGNGINYRLQKGKFSNFEVLDTVEKVRSIAECLKRCKNYKNADMCAISGDETSLPDLAPSSTEGNKRQENL